MRCVLEAEFKVVDMKRAGDWKSELRFDDGFYFLLGESVYEDAHI